MAKRLGGIRKPKKPVLRDETYLTKLKNFWHRHRSKILLAGGLGAVAYLAKRKFANKIIANQAQHNAILSQPVSTEI